MADIKDYLNVDYLDKDTQDICKLRIEYNKTQLAKYALYISAASLIISLVSLICTITQ